MCKSSKSSDDDGSGGKRMSAPEQSGREQPTTVLSMPDGSVQVTIGDLAAELSAESVTISWLSLATEANPVKSLINRHHTCPHCGREIGRMTSNGGDNSGVEHGD